VQTKRKTLACIVWVGDAESRARTQAGARRGEGVSPSGGSLGRGPVDAAPDTPRPSVQRRRRLSCKYFSVKINRSSAIS
jgi:hypothetical protein